MKKLSLIIICYNIEFYIKRCIESLLVYEKEDIEIIIIDDGSTDNTFNLVKFYEKEDKRVRGYTQANGGPMKARETGFYKARGEYVWFIDGDDWIEKNGISKIMRIINMEKDFELLLMGSNYVYENNTREIKKSNNRDMTNKEFLKKLFIGEVNGCLWDKIISRRFIKDKKIPFNTELRIGEDTLFSINLGVRVSKIIEKNINIYNYFQRNDSITHKISERVIDTYYMLEKCNKLMENIKGVTEEKAYFIYLHGFKYQYQYIVNEGEFGNTLLKKYKKIENKIYKNKYFHDEGRVDKVKYYLIINHCKRILEIFYKAKNRIKMKSNLVPKHTEQTLDKYK
ncbi:MAG: glycosyltransferase family 2 protein [Clostridium sp.]